MPEPAERPQWPYALWGAVGVLVGFGVVGILSIGIFLLGLAFVLSVLGALLPASRTSTAVAAVPGLSAAPLMVAVNNFGGPGERCSSGPGYLSCGELLNPWPFAIVGLALLLPGAWLLWRVARSEAVG